MFSKDTKKYMKDNRSSFSGQIGFILAAAGSAVGLGNIWRFPYLAAKYGGGTFLLVYFILLISFGFSLTIAEIAIGRKTGLSSIGAYKSLNHRFKFLGILASIIPFIILPYYSVIGGWVVKYLTVYITGNGSQAVNDKFFSDYISSPIEPSFWLFVTIGVTAIIVMFGVKKGIERASRFIMPSLVILSIVIAIYSVTRPGAWAGVLYYITPDFSRFSINTVLAAIGQLFYSMSIAMGILITYGSYVDKNIDLEKSTKRIEIFDFGIAFIAGLMIIPAVFAFSGGDQSQLSQGPGLMFVTLPKVFEGMQFGHIIGGIFFLLVAFAALTSTISLMETIVSILQDKFKLNRKITCLIVASSCFLIGIPSALGFGVWDFLQPLGMSILDFFDFISNNILMPIVAFATCILVGYVIKPKALIDEVELSGKFKRKKLFIVMIKYIAPICLLTIFVTKILEVLGLFNL